MSVDLTVEDPRWEALDLEELAERAIDAALRHVALDPEDCEVSLMACGDARIAELNRAFRGKPDPTNVLSWPAEDLAADAPGAAPRRPETDFSGEIALGDIAIAWETCAREAESAGRPLGDHVTHLIVHGLLHLLGYDHVDDADAARMEGAETEILGKLGLEDPYRGATGA